MLHRYRLDELNDQAQGLRELNFGTDAKPLYLDFEVDQIEDWKILIVHDIYNETIAAGDFIDGPLGFNHFLDRLENAHNDGTGSFWVAGLREAHETALRAKVTTLAERTGYHRFDLTIDRNGDAYNPPVYVITDPDEGTEYFAFLTEAELNSWVEKFYIMSAIERAESVDESITAVTDARAAGWGNLYEGEIRRRRRAARAGHPTMTGGKR